MRNLKQEPPLETSVVRFIRTRLEMIHQERGICVIAGPWGIGKTTAITSFAAVYPKNCVIVKVEQGAMRQGASPLFVLQQIVEAFRPYLSRNRGGRVSGSYRELRQLVYRCLEEWMVEQNPPACSDAPPRLSLVFDEAQYLSRDAIEMLRFWNDQDRTVTPFCLSLMFLGNSEFALQENVHGDSALSGAVRSRALFAETLDYNDVLDEDVALFFNSLGQYEADALAFVSKHFSGSRVRRDFRSMVRLDQAFRRRSRSTVVTLDVARTVLH